MANSQRTKPQIFQQLSTATCCGATNCKASSNINFSTGVDASGTVLPSGTIDPEWVTINLPPISGSYHSSISLPNSYIIDPYQNNWNSLSGAGIISSANTAALKANNTQPWRVRRYFCICEKTRVSFKGQIKADDKGVLVLYDPNDNEIFRVNTIPNQSFTQPASFSETHLLPTGTYYFEFELLNIGGVAAGFSVAGSIKTKPNSLLNGTSRCCSNGYTFKPCCPPWSKNDLSSMLFISGNTNIYKPSFELSKEFKQRMKAYSNYAMSLDPCLERVTVKYAIREPYADPNKFNLASKTILTEGGTVFHKNQSITTFGQSTLSNINLQGNKWYRLDIVLFGEPSSCPKWNIAEDCIFPQLQFNLMSIGRSKTNSINGTIRDVGASIE